ncbi:tRNA wybutosine-synthesizing protein 3 homolog isoform 2-T2 [Menidia menidia]
MEETFEQRKKYCLNKLDLSKKGSVDEDIQHVVYLINSCKDLFTTSSCSGRIILFDGFPNNSDVQKKGCVWLFVAHSKCTFDDLMSGLSRSTNDAVLKFEPFVLHVQCRRLEDAQLMAIRSTHGLEVPLTHNGKLLVEHDYIHFLIQKVNAKMEQNIQRIQRFYKSLQAALSSDKIHNLDTLTLQNEEDLSQTKETEKEKE